MFILKKGHQPGVYVPLRALFLVHERHVQSACKHHQQYVTSEIYVKMLGNLYSCLACIYICFQIDFC